MRGDGGVFQYPQSTRWWISFWVNGRNVPQSAAKTEAEARKILKASLKQLAEGG